MHVSNFEHIQTDVFKKRQHCNDMAMQNCIKMLLAQKQYHAGCRCKKIHVIINVLFQYIIFRYLFEPSFLVTWHHF